MAELRAAVEKAGYSLAQPRRGLVTAPGHDEILSAETRDGFAPGRAADAREPSRESTELVDERSSLDAARQRELDDLRRAWTVSLAVGVAMMALMYLPLNVPMDVLAPVLLIAATVVQFWAGRPIYAAAWAAARHGGTNMHTLVAVGTTVAYAYSAFVTLWPRLAMQLGSPAGPVLRNRRDHHRADPARALAGGAREEADRRRHQSADGSPGENRARHSRRARAGRADGGRPGWRPGARPTGREGAGRRRRSKTVPRRWTRAC